MTDSALGSPKLPPETDAAIVEWMTRQGWRAASARWEMDPETGFFVWQEQKEQGEVHALWVAEPMIRHLSADELLDVLNGEGVAEDLRISFRVQIQELGDEYRVRPAPRGSVN